MILGTGSICYGQTGASTYVLGDWGTEISDEASAAANAVFFASFQGVMIPFLTLSQFILPCRVRTEGILPLHLTSVGRLSVDMPLADHAPLALIETLQQ